MSNPQEDEAASDSRGERQPQQQQPPLPRGPSEKKRRRPALACEECRRRKVRCCRNIPCTNCIRAQRASQCTYQADSQPPLRRLTAAALAPAAAAPRRAPDPGLGLSPAPDSFPGGLGTDSEPPPLFHYDVNGRQDLTTPLPLNDVDTPFTGTSVPVAIALPPGSSSSESGRRTPSSHFSGSTTVTLLTDRVKELEERLSQLLGPGKARPRPAHLPAAAMSKGTLAKTRYYGPSHYLQSASLFKTQLDIIRSNETFNSPLWEPLARCKRLGRAIKAKRNPDVVPRVPGTHIPPRDVCDRLVDGYLRSFETVYRILHVPSFESEYRRYWGDPSAANRTFVVQMQLVMAIGACLYDEDFSLRQLATEWIFEAQHWLIAPSSAPSPSLKSRLTISGLQNMCLLHFARETTAVGPDLVWISVGELYRQAVYMGLHRDPDHLVRISRLRAEVRRRLWATIVEITLQASIDSGGPAAMSLGDFDTRPPANFDDDQLVEAASGGPEQPMPPQCFTQSSVAIALYRSFPTRLAVAHYLNDFRCRNAYDMTLRLSSEVTNARRALAVTLQSFRPRGVPGKPDAPSGFQILFTEQIMHRFLTALHVPWQAASQRDPRYYFSRKISVETAMSMFRALQPKQAPQSPAPPPGNVGGRNRAADASLDRADYMRICTNGSGPYRAITYQSLMILAAELFWQLEEERAAKVSAGDSDLSLPAFTEIPNSYPGFSLSTTKDADEHVTPPTARPVQPGVPKPAGSTRAASHVGVSSPRMSGVGLGVVPYQEAVEAVRFAADITAKRIFSGETNIKGHLFFRSLFAHADSLRRGDPDAEIRRVVIESMEECADRCYDMLKLAASRIDVEPQPEDDPSQQQQQPQQPQQQQQNRAEDVTGSIFGGGMWAGAGSQRVAGSGGGGDGGSDCGAGVDVDMTAIDDELSSRKVMAFGAMADNSFTPLDQDPGGWDWDAFFNNQGFNNIGSSFNFNFGVAETL